MPLISALVSVRTDLGAGGSHNPGKRHFSVQKILLGQQLVHIDLATSHTNLVALSCVSVRTPPPVLRASIAHPSMVPRVRI